MLIGLCGGICSGKQTIADYLIKHHAFTQLHLQLEPLNEPRPNIVKQDDHEKGKTRPACANISGTSTSTPKERTFDTADDLLDFVTKNWQSLWVITDIQSEEIFDQLDRRPFFILVSVDAPVHMRWKRLKERMQSKGASFQDIPSLEEFVLDSDKHLYNLQDGLLPLICRATIKLLNTSSDIAHFHARLSGVNLLNNDRIRPNWDLYFMQLASLGARRSNCMKRRVGCVIVEDRRVISTGYNGTPRGLKNCADGGCPRCNEGQGSGVGLGTCLCLHAEENALLEAGRGRIREGTILYCDTCPCLTCSIKIAQVGISEVVYSQGYCMDGDTADVFRQAGVRLRQFTPPANGMIYL